MEPPLKNGCNFCKEMQEYVTNPIEPTLDAYKTKQNG